MLTSKDYVPPSEPELKFMMHKRIEQLKTFKQLANVILDQNKVYKSLLQKPDWQNKVVEQNILNLQNLIKDINSIRKDEDRIRKYCLGTAGDFTCSGEFFSQFNELTFLSEVSNYAVPGSITYDVNWLSVLSVQEKIDISLGKEKPDILERYWDYQCQTVSSKLQDGLGDKSSLKEAVRLAFEGISIGRQKFYTSSNLILFAVCESLMRYLATNLYFFQNPGTTFEAAESLVNTLQSLERILLYDKWKNDLEYPIIRINAKYGYIPEPEIMAISLRIRKAMLANQKLKIKIEELADHHDRLKIQPESDDEERQKINQFIQEARAISSDLTGENEKGYINIRVKLHFLIRRFKEDRNAIVHGQFDGFNRKWKNLVYLSALEKIVDCIVEYDKLYHFN